MPLELLFNPILKATTALGVPVPLALANFYAAGSSSTRQNTYTTATQAVANANPVVADANGLFPPIFLLPLAYHIVITDPTGTTTYFDQDNVAGPNYNALFDDSWQLKDNLDPTKILKFQLSSLTTGTTRTKTWADTNGVVLDSLSAIMGAATLQLAQGTNITAANDITIPTNGNLFYVTGATQINRIATPTFQVGTVIHLLFASNPTVKHNQAAGGGFSTILLNGSADFVAAGNMIISLMWVGATAWIEVPRRS